MSTEDQADHGASLEAQRSAITAYCQRESWTLVNVVSETASAKDTNRPELQAVIEILEGTPALAEILIVSRLDRLSRSVVDFMQLLERAERRGYKIVCLDPMVNMADPFGKAMAAMAAVFAQLERELIGQRTRDGIAQRKREGTYTGGRPRVVDPDLEHRISRMGGSNRTIAAALNAEGISAPMGGAWTHSSIGRIRGRAE